MKTIVEVGAHKGVETLHFLSDAEAYVYAFEPDQKFFRELQVLSPQRHRLTALPFAVDLGDNQESLFEYPEGKSTLAHPFFREEKPRGFQMVWTMRLDTFMNLYSIDKIDYLRIDAPFAEENCLESLGGRIKDVEKGRIRQYQHPSAITAFLYDHGFNMAKDVNDTAENFLPDVRFWR